MVVAVLGSASMEEGIINATYNDGDRKLSHTSCPSNTKT